MMTPFISDEEEINSFSNYELKILISALVRDLRGNWLRFYEHRIAILRKALIALTVAASPSELRAIRSIEAIIKEELESMMLDGNENVDGRVFRNCEFYDFAPAGTPVSARLESYLLNGVLTYPENFLNSDNCNAPIE